MPPRHAAPLLDTMRIWTARPKRMASFPMPLLAPVRQRRARSLLRRRSVLMRAERRSAEAAIQRWLNEGGPDTTAADGSGVL